MIRTISRPNH